MTLLSTLSQQQMNTFHKVIQDSLSVRRHHDLFNWLNGDFQRLVPHDILLTAWGNFSLGLVQLNIVSRLPGVRTAEVDKEALMPFLLKVFDRWSSSSWAPLVLAFENSNSHLCPSTCTGAFGNTIARQRSALVHGIKDERGRHDCLYVALNTEHTYPLISADWIVLLLPYIDTALRQVAHLPVQYPDFPEEPVTIVASHPANNGTVSTQDSDISELSDREVEIVELIRIGKTNSEIGMILDISFFTVKNHVQRIFRKLDVLNRAQAVATYEKLTKPSHRTKSVANQRLFT